MSKEKTKVFVEAKCRCQRCTVSSNSLNYLTNSSPPDPMPSTPFNLNSILLKAECLSIRLKTDDAPLGTS